MKATKLFFPFLFFIFTFSFSNAQSWLWAKQGVNTTVNDIVDPFAIATDISGNIYEAGGYWNGKILFGAYSLNPTNGGENGFLVKFDQNGNVLWAKSPIVKNLTGSCGVSSISPDRKGNLYIIGVIQDTVTFGAFQLASPHNANTFIAKYNASGNVLWAICTKSTSHSGNTAQYSPSGVTDDSNNIYITGAYIDTVAFGPIQLFDDSNRLENTFVVKYDSNGNVKWARSSILANNINSTSFGSAIVTDTSGNIYVSGRFENRVTFTPYSLSTNRNSGNIFIVKYSPNGNVVWVYNPILPSNIGGPVYYSNAYNYSSMASYYSKYIYLSGTFLDTLQFGSYKLINNNSASVFIAKFDTGGNVIWANSATTPSGKSNGINNAITSDKWGNIYLSGNFQDTIAFGINLTLKSVAYSPSYIVKMDSLGNTICGTSINNYNDDDNAIASDPLGPNAYFGGDVEHYLYCILGNDTINSSVGNETAFLAKWTCNNSEGITPINPQIESLTLFPNPNNGKFTIKSSVISGPSSVEIYNVLGEKVYNGMLNQVQHDYIIDLSSQPNGIYLYRALKKDGELIGSGKVIIQR